MFNDFKNLPLDRSLPSSLVNIDEKSRSNLFTWRGQFSPQLVEQLLINYSGSKQVVFDPFLGSGTVLYEAALLGLSAVGTEINPAAISFAKIYELANVPREDIIASVANIEDFISHYTSDLPLFSDKAADEFVDDIIERFDSCKEPIERSILNALITGLDLEAKKFDIKRLKNVWSALKGNIDRVPSSSAKISCYQADARKTPISKNTVDIVITSPPYINVFNYHQNYRKSVEKTGVDVLTVAKSEIGANRKFRQNRFLTVVQYCMDLAEVFIELKRVCKPTAKIFLIVGRESNVRRTAFKNAELISSVLELAGFDVVGEQDDVLQ